MNNLSGLRKNLLSLFFKLIPLTVFLTIWEIAAHDNEKIKFLFGSPESVLNTLVSGFLNGTLTKHTLITGAEAILGFAIGSVAGALVGLALWFSSKVAGVARPYVVVLGSIPIFAVAPMMIIWFGTGFLSKVIMAAISTFFPTLLQAYVGAKQTEKTYTDMFMTLGANRVQIFRKLVVPSSLVWVMSSFRLGVSFALLGAFIGEFISSEEGLGHIILKAGGLYDTPMVLAGVTCMAILSLLFTKIVSFAETLAQRYKEQLA